ncbi:MAG: homoserine dehydrogenase [Deltaproteobacteria bacterium]|nr:MAG: homoserine dehydrogenase [Deltaproteobacteria bacterium]
MRQIGVGLLGLGNVGSGVVRLLAENAEAIEDRLGAQLVVRAIAVRAPDKPRAVDVDPALVTTDAGAVIDRDDVDIVCELVGGETDARDYVLRAIDRGKHVVTANKALLAVHGEEVFTAAERRGVDVYYEAAVCAGVPIIRALREGLASDRIESVYGIVNGTSNFILTRMAEEGAPFDEVVRAAQEAGYAEADPSFDVDGIDAAHKLAILTMLCFGTSVALSDIYIEDIRSLSPVDFAFADRFGYVIKPLAIARAHDDGLELRVHPTMVPKSWLLASVPGANNALYVRSYALGPSMYYGAGAGMMPTAVAAVSDLIEVSRNVLANAAGHLPLRSYARMPNRPVRDIGRLDTPYYMRFGVLDRPGVLGQLTTVLGDHQISIAQVVQEGPREPERPVRVVVLTHAARESNVRHALAQVAKLASVVEPAQIIRIAQ